MPIIGLRLDLSGRFILFYYIVFMAAMYSVVCGELAVRGGVQYKLFYSEDCGCI